MFPRILVYAFVAGLAFRTPLHADDASASTEAERNYRESELLKKRLAERDAQIGALERELQAAKRAIAASALLAKALQDRCEQLQLALEEAQLELNALRSNAGLPEIVPDPARRLLIGGAEALPGRLPIHLCGKVVAVADRSGLVEVSIGFEAGVRKGHVLDLYRLVPENPRASVYLGQLTILETSAQRAVGRYAAANYGRPPRAGDEAALIVERDKGR